MEVTFLKPDFSVRGGFELLLDRCRAGLEQRGFRTSLTTFHAHEAPPRLAGLPLPHRLWFRHPEYFSYLANVERVGALSFPDDTVVVTTQPPTFLADHHRQVALTYHQGRVFYDLAAPYVASGFIPAEIHERATAEIRRLDADRLPEHQEWLAGSAEVASRLASYWGVTVSGLFQAHAQEPPDPDIAARYDPGGPVLCVSRHAWPKRTELAVLAAICDHGGRHELIGGGGRQPYVEAVAHHFAGDPAAAAAAADTDIWLNRGDPDVLEPTTSALPSRLRIRGHQPREVVIDAYCRAGVVVAPAHREDYGLTVLEAFAFGRPVVICDDGGGLVELVEGTGAGLVVEPRPAAIAEAVRSIRQDPATSRAMAEAALQVAVDHHRRDDLAVLADAIRRAGDR